MLRNLYVAYLFVRENFLKNFLWNTYTIIENLFSIIVYKITKKGNNINTKLY